MESAEDKPSKRMARHMQAPRVEPIDFDEFQSKRTLNRKPMPRLSSVETDTPLLDVMAESADEELDTDVGIDKTAFSSGMIRSKCVGAGEGWKGI